jgi:hypothetical protein
MFFITETEKIISTDDLVFCGTQDGHNPITRKVFILFKNGQREIITDGEKDELLAFLIARGEVKT